jgi:hypothetical protein
LQDVVVLSGRRTITSERAHRRLLRAPAGTRDAGSIDLRRRGIVDVGS